MASLAVLVNPAWPAVTTLEGIIDRTMKEGEDSSLPAAGAVSLLGLPERDFTVKQVRAESDDCVDGKVRLFSVLLDEDGSKTGNLWFFAIYYWPGNSETHNYLTTLDGELLKASRGRGKRDSDGNPVSGSGSVVNLDTDSPEVKAKFRKELDFWVKGKGRKKAKAAGRPAAPEKDERPAAARG